MMLSELDSEKREDKTSDKLLKADDNEKSSEFSFKFVNEICKELKTDNNEDSNKFSSESIKGVSHFVLFDEAPKNSNSLELCLSDNTNQKVENDLDESCTNKIEAVEEKSYFDDTQIYSCNKNYVKKKSSSQSRYTTSQHAKETLRISSEIQHATEIESDLQMPIIDEVTTFRKCTIITEDDYGLNYPSQRKVIDEQSASTSSLQTHSEICSFTKGLKKHSSLNENQKMGSPTNFKKITVGKKTKKSFNHQRKGNSHIFTANAGVKTDVGTFPKKNSRISNEINNVTQTKQLRVSLTDIMCSQDIKNELKNKSDISFVNRLILSCSNGHSDVVGNGTKPKTNKGDPKQSVTLQTQQINLSQVSCKNSNTSPPAEKLSMQFESTEIKKPLKIAVKSSAEQIKFKRNKPRKKDNSQNDKLQKIDKKSIPKKKVSLKESALPKNVTPKQLDNPVSKVKISLNQELISINKDMPKECKPNTQDNPVLKKGDLNNLNSSNTFKKIKDSNTGSSTSQKNSPFMKLFDKISGNQSNHSGIYKCPIQLNLISNFLAGYNNKLESPRKQKEEETESEIDLKKNMDKTKLIQSNVSCIYDPAKSYPNVGGGGKKILATSKSLLVEPTESLSQPLARSVVSASKSSLVEPNESSPQSSNSNLSASKRRLRKKLSIESITDKSLKREECINMSSSVTDSNLSLKEKFKQKTFLKECVTDKSNLKSKSTNSNLGIKEALKNKMFSEENITNKPMLKRKRANSNFGKKEELTDKMLSRKNITEKPKPKRKKRNSILNSMEELKDMPARKLSEESITDKSTPNRKNTNSDLIIKKELKTLSEENITDKPTLERKQANSNLGTKQELKNNAFLEENITDKPVSKKKHTNFNFSTEGIKIAEFKPVENRDCIVRRSYRNPSKKKSETLNLESCKSSVKKTANSKKEPCASTCKQDVCDFKPIKRGRCSSVYKSINKSSLKEKRANSMEPTLYSSIPESTSSSVNESSLKAKRANSMEPYLYSSSSVNESSPTEKRATSKEPTLYISKSKKDIKTPSKKKNRGRIPKNSSSKQRESVTTDSPYFYEFSGGNTTKGTNQSTSHIQNHLNSNLNKNINDKPSNSDQNSNNPTLNNSYLNAHYNIQQQYYQISAIPADSKIFYNYATNSPVLATPIMPPSPGASQTGDCSSIQPQVPQPFKAQNVQNNISISPYTSCNTSQNLVSVVTPQDLTSFVATRNLASALSRCNSSPATPQNFTFVTPQNFVSIAPQNSVFITPQNFTSLISASVAPWNSASVAPRNSASVAPRNSASVAPRNSASVAPRNSASVAPWNSASVTPQNFAPQTSPHVTSQNSVSVTPQNSASVESQNFASVVPQNFVTYPCFQSAMNPNILSGNVINSVMPSGSEDNYNNLNKMPSQVASNIQNGMNIYTHISSIPPASIFLPESEIEQKQFNPNSKKKPRRIKKNKKEISRSNTQSPIVNRPRTCEVVIHFNWEKIMNRRDLVNVSEVHKIGRKFYYYSVKEFCSTPVIFNKLNQQVNDNVSQFDLVSRVHYEFNEEFIFEPFVNVLKDFTHQHLVAIYPKLETVCKEEIKSVFFSMMYAKFSLRVCKYFGDIMAPLKILDVKDLISCFTLVAMLVIFCEFRKKNGTIS